MAKQMESFTKEQAIKHAQAHLTAQNQNTHTGSFCALGLMFDTPNLQSLSKPGDTFHMSAVSWYMGARRQGWDFILMCTPCGQSHAKRDWDHTSMWKKEGVRRPRSASVLVQARYTKTRGDRFKCKAQMSSIWLDFNDTGHWKAEYWIYKIRSWIKSYLFWVFSYFPPWRTNSCTGP